MTEITKMSERALSFCRSGSKQRARCDSLHFVFPDRARVMAALIQHRLWHIRSSYLSTQHIPTGSCKLQNIRLQSGWKQSPTKPPVMGRMWCDVITNRLWDRHRLWDFTTQAAWGNTVSVLLYGKCIAACFHHTLFCFHPTFSGVNVIIVENGLACMFIRRIAPERKSTAKQSKGPQSLWLYLRAAPAWQAV